MDSRQEDQGYQPVNLNESIIDSTTDQQQNVNVMPVMMAQPVAVMATGGAQTSIVVPQQMVMGQQQVQLQMMSQQQHAQPQVMILVPNGQVPSQLKSAEQREECCGCIEIKQGMKIISGFFIYSAVCYIFSTLFYIIYSQEVDVLIMMYYGILLTVISPILCAAYLFYQWLRKDTLQTRLNLQNAFLILIGVQFASFMIEFFGESIIFGKPFAVYTFDKHLKPMYEKIENSSQFTMKQKIDMQINKDQIEIMTKNAKIYTLISKLYSTMFLVYYYKVSKRFTSLMPAEQ